MHTTFAPQTTSMRTSVLEPRTWSHSVLLFVIAYPLSQAFAAWGLNRLFSDPVPFSTVAAWRHFLLVVTALGVLAGTCWWISLQIRRTLLRWYVRSATRFLALSTLLAADELTRMPTLAWLTMVVGGAALSGALFFWTERWEDAGSPRLPPDTR